MADLPDCMEAEDLAHARIYERDGRTYIIRDAWSDGGYEYRDGLTLARCEYLVWRGDLSLEWKPCAEGVEFADIEPAFTTITLHG